MRKYARLLIAAFGIAFAIFVALQFKTRAPEPAPQGVVRTDPGAVVESTGGTVQRFKLSREDAWVQYDKQLTYADGSIRLFGVKILTDERGGRGRSFTVTAKEGKVGQKETNLELDGNVQLSASDGMTVRTEHATADRDGTVRAPGPIEFMRGRMSGRGTGMTYDDGRDLLSLLADASVHIAPDAKGAGAADITSATAVFARRDKYVRFESGVKVQRAGQLIEADSAMGHLSADEDHIETVELRNNARITSAKAAAGALQALTGRDMNLKYGANGESLEHAVIEGDAVIQLAGEARKAGRQIAAKTVEISLAPDGSTPTALVGRDTVQVTFPPEADTPGRAICSTNLDAKGTAASGLTRAVFTGGVRLRERKGDLAAPGCVFGGPVDLGANAATMDVGLKTGFSSIESATFSHDVRFVQGKLTAVAAAGRYDLEKGTLELQGSEPGAEVPHVDNDRIAVDATKIDVTLTGPKVKATGTPVTPVKSVLQPPKKGDENAAEGGNKMPAMLKQDQPVTVLSNTLDYDGTASKGIYTGSVRLFQSDTSIKAATIVLDDKTGDLVATGPVTTTTLLEQTTKDKKKEKAHSIATAKDFQYEDAIRRLTYTGDAHMTGPQGDMTAAKIELYLKPSGDELERAEAYDALTLREQNRTTTGARMTYTTDDEKYVVTGTPVEIVDECGRHTTGKTLTFTKATDTIVVDGNNQVRTQTKGGGKCPS